MSNVTSHSDDSGNTATEQKAEHEVLNMINWFLDSVIYDLVTWVAIAFCIGLTLIYLFAVSPRNWRGVFWSGIALAICASIIIAVRIDQRFLRGATVTARDTEKAKEEAEPSVGIYTINLLKALAIGEHPTIRVIFKNGPRVPIEGLAARVRLVVHNRSIADAIKEFPLEDFKSDTIGNVLIEGQQRVVDFPQISFVMDANRLAAINTGAVHLYVVGKGSYRGNGREYSFPFYAMYDPSDGGFTEPESTPEQAKAKKPSPPQGISVPGQLPDDKTRTLAYRSGAQAWRSKFDGLYDYEELRYTSYTEDYFGGAIWRWGYRPEMGDQVPRNIRGFCPEDGFVLRDSWGRAVSGAGLHYVNFSCQDYNHKSFNMPSEGSDPYEGVKKLIQKKLQSGEWRETVYHQRLRNA